MQNKPFPNGQLGIRVTYHSLKTKEWLPYNVGKVSKTPPQSPDTNPFQNLMASALFGSVANENF